MKANKASKRELKLSRMLGTELPCEPPLPGVLPLSCCPPPLGTGLGVGVRLATGMGDGEGMAVGAGVGVTGVSVRVGMGVGVGDSVGVGVGVATQLQETLTEFAGPVKVIVSFEGQGMLEGTVMFTVTRPLG